MRVRNSSISVSFALSASRFSLKVWASVSVSSRFSAVGAVRTLSSSVFSAARASSAVSSCVRR